MLTNLKTKLSNLCMNIAITCKIPMPFLSMALIFVIVVFSAIIGAIIGVVF